MYGVCKDLQEVSMRKVSIRLFELDSVIATHLPVRLSLGKPPSTVLVILCCNFICVPLHYIKRSFSV